MDNHGIALVLALPVLLTGLACGSGGSTAGIDFACSDGVCPRGLSCIENRCLAEASQDAASLDAALDDAGDQCQCVADDLFDSCSDVQELAASTKVCRSTAGNSNSLLGCTGQPLPGPDTVFRISLAADTTMSLVLRPEGFDGALYLAADCAGTCLQVANELGLGGSESLEYSSPVATDLYVVVDSPSGAGCFELDLELIGN